MTNLAERIASLEGRFVRGRFIVVFSTLVGLMGLVVTVMVVRRMDARDARDDLRAADRDALAAAQRAHLLELVELQHECSLPARPGQHDPEPIPHVHECWDEAAGALLKGQQEQLDTLLQSTKNTEEVVNFLNSPARQRAISDALRQINENTTRIFERTRFEVTDPSRPDREPLIITPIVEDPKPPCQPVVGPIDALDRTLQLCLDP